MGIAKRLGRAGGVAMLTLAFHVSQAGAAQNVRKIDPGKAADNIEKDLLHVAGVGLVIAVAFGVIGPLLARKHGDLMRHVGMSMVAAALVLAPLTVLGLAAGLFAKL
jgi:cytochrome c oxidase assembly factor CtaG